VTVLTQLSNGDWIELASIVHVTATEIARGEWAVIGHLPGGQWFTLAPEGTKLDDMPSKLLTPLDAIRLRDQWASDINEAKIEGTRAEATERLTVLREWRRAHPARTTWTADAIIPHVREMGEEEKARFLKAIREIKPGDLVVVDKDVTYIEIDKTPKVEGYYSSRPEVIMPHEGCTATAIIGGIGHEHVVEINVNHPALIHTLKAADTVPPDPIFHCPRCGREASRSDWCHIGLYLDNNDDLRCPKCWIEAKSVIPLEGPALASAPHPPAAGVAAGAREIAALDAIVDRYKTAAGTPNKPEPPAEIREKWNKLTREQQESFMKDDHESDMFMEDITHGRPLEPSADESTWRDRAIAEPML
jgi:hypothetical protein